jgi:hypothetical protein
MARSEGFYERFAKSVAPSIFGSVGKNVYNRCPRAEILTTSRHQKGDHMSSFRWL